MATTKRWAEPSTELEGTKKKFKSGNVFSWTYDKIDLFLGVVKNFKSDKQGEGIDWESIKTKHEDIHGIFLDRYPKDVENHTNGKDFKCMDSFCGPGYQHSNNLLA